MALRCDNANVQINITRNADSTYSAKFGLADGAVSDPAGTDRYQKGPYAFSAEVTWDRNKTGAQLIADVVAAIEAAAKKA